jgi:hypothetical protein
MLQRGRRTKIDREITEQIRPLTAPNRRPTAADQRRRWREDCDEAAEINFAHCVGQKAGTTEAEWVELSALGWAKRRGVPAALVQQWERERRK